MRRSFYPQIFFGGAVIPWLMNSMAGVLRGTGNMVLGAAVDGYVTLDQAPLAP